MAKYIIDLDALMSCLDLLPVPSSINGNDCVYLDDVFAMIARFPKEDYGNESSGVITKVVDDMNPCRNCETGWGSISTEGYRGCEETCTRLKEYNEKYG